jgi:DNA-binding CsgD family transcriptional regulator/PAS domain-containing protein
MLDLVEELYAVAAEPSLWRGWLGRLCEVLRTDAAILIRGFEPGAGDQGTIAVGLEAEQSERLGTPSSTAFTVGPTGVPPYLAYLADDARLLSEAVAMGPGELLVLSEVLPPAEFLASRLYREWLKPRGLYHLVSTVVSRGPRHITGLSLLRRRRRLRFSPDDLDQLQRLLPHLQRVTQLGERLEGAARRSEAARQVLESARCGVVLLDQKGRVCSANRLAGTLLALREGVELDGERLRAEDAREASALENLVADAVSGGESQSGGILLLSRPARRHPLVVSVIPLNGHDANAETATGGGALVLLSDPEDLPVLREAELCRLYGLTDAEARVAARVARGETVDEVATTLGIRPSTVKTHLQRVLSKTGTRRQLELARLLMAAAVGGTAPDSEETPRLIRSEDAGKPDRGV